MADAGVTVLTGTDAGNWGTIQGYSVHRELIKLVAAGLRPWDALAASTTRAGEFLGRSWGVSEGDAANLVVLDAAQLGAEPGAVRLLAGADMDTFIGQGKRSVHEVGLVDLMTIATLLNRLPANRALLGIQPAEFGWGETTSAAVSGVIPEAASQVVALLYKWQQQTNN